MSNAFCIPPAIHYGPGALGELGQTARHLGFKRTLLVTDSSMVRLGVVGQATRHLERAGVLPTVFDTVQPDPTTKNVEDGLTLLRGAGCDSLVAVGGGSPIDCAKAIALSSTNRGALAEYAGLEKLSHPSLPVVAVPTTAGTGSEVTRVTVITDVDRDVKMMIASRYIVCTAAIVDPELTLSMPPALTAAVGVDALTHAIEAYVSLRAQPLTDLLALSAIRLIAAHLRTAWTDGSNLTARSAVMLGAMQAGMAFSNASVALVHGMARPLGACFHLTHGQSIAVLLPVVTEFSLTSAADRYAQVASEMGAADLVTALRQLNRDIEIPSMRDLGVTLDRLELLIPKMAADALASGSPAFNPRRASAEEIAFLYRTTFEGG